MYDYMMIENVGISPVECFTLMGVSTTRYSGYEGCIGQFGSGTKYAINLLLRNNIDFCIFCGKLKMEFFCKQKDVDDGKLTHMFNRVCVRLTGKDESGKQLNRLEDLGWVLELGEADWTNLSMALREFVSNAIDRTYREDKTLDDIKITMVDEPSVRAKNGHTRVFIKANDEVVNYFLGLSKRFLHFSTADKQFCNKSCIIPKNRDRSINNKGKAVIYKKGVFVRELESSADALFDYNINDLHLDESRNASDSAVKQYIGDLIGSTENQSVIETILETLKVGEERMEFKSVDYYSLVSSRDESAKGRWELGWKKVFGEKSIINSGTDLLGGHIVNKGFVPINIANSVWSRFLHSCGVRNEADILTHLELKGIDTKPANVHAGYARNRIWELLKRHNLTDGKAEPEVLLFTKIMAGGIETQGFYSDGKVYIEEALCTNLNKKLLKVMLEEIVHYLTGSLDCSRDIQDYMFRLVVEMAF